MTTTISPSRVIPVWLSPKMWRGLFLLFAGKLSTCEKPNKTHCPKETFITFYKTINRPPLTIPTFLPDVKGIASRDSSGKVLNAIAKRHPWLIGGSADLSPSTKTRLTFEGAGEISRDSLGARNIHFGVREHAMGAILNGLALAKLRGFGSGFLIFSDYGRGSLRLAAIMELPVIYIFTHDSIGVGQDGPTHQPVEHLPSLRAIPGLTVIRPCDANEVAEAWRVMMEKKYDPVALILSRQALPTWDRSKFAPASGLRQGAYVLSDPTDGKPSVLLIATGSEVSLCVWMRRRR